MKANHPTTQSTAGLGTFLRNFSGGFSERATFWHGIKDQVEQK
jgi:hypothetical protein